LNGLATFRHRKVCWSRRVLGAFAVAWLSMTLQSCAFAADVDSPDCPHCPQTGAPHCELTLGPGCGCDEPLNVESRSVPAKLKDTSNDLPIVIWPVSFETAAAARLMGPMPGGAVVLNPSGPPRNVLFCVYLK
jgi:hypothetical protein